MDIVGVLHLPALPGAPRAPSSLAQVRDRAVADAGVLVAAGIRTAVIENLGDAPFDAGAVQPHVVAFMTRVALDVQQATGGQLALGINVLRNDACAALGIAAALGARFVRVNVHTGAAWTDQGLIQGRAADTLRYRRQLKCEPTRPTTAGWLHDDDPGVRIAADVHVKHATPAGTEDIADAAADLAGRGGADLVIVTGRHTGGAADRDQLSRVRQRLPGATVWLGSGATPTSLPELRGLVDGAIVGTWLHRDGDLDAPLDLDRCRAVVHAAVG